jgi:dienelactone hydrolase
MGVEARRARCGRTVAAVVGIVVTAATLAACAPPPRAAHGPDPDAAPAADEPRYLGPGPDAVGVTTLDLGDRKVDVWYPAEAVDGPDAVDQAEAEFAPELRALLPAGLSLTVDLHGHRDAPPVGTAHPLVLFAHGIFSWRDQSAALLAHLASWGFVVASPDLPEYGLSALSFPGVPFFGDSEAAMDRVVARLRAEEAGTGLLAGRIDLDEIAVTGHSLGGALATLYASRPFVRAYVPLASALVPPQAGGGSAKPAMWIRATTDQTHADVLLPLAEAAATGPTAVVSIRGGGHVGPFATELCDAGGVGVIGLLASHGIFLPEQLAVVADDGCHDPSRQAQAAIVAHFLTAELRWQLGLDPEPVGLGSGVVAHLPAAATYTHTP